MELIKHANLNSNIFTQFNSFKEQTTCILVNLYYYINTYLDEMKIFPSSPYAIFNVQEWDSLVNGYKKNNTCKLRKSYYKNSKKYNLTNSAQKEIKEIQLFLIN